MLNTVKFAAALFVKYFALVFYTLDCRWVESTVCKKWEGVRLVVFLNHTSLFEPLYFSAVPLRFLWSFISKGVYPGADSTLQRPFVGNVIKLIGPKVIPISRKRDNTWQVFLDAIEGDSIIAIMPEGRMKRADGLDKKGNPMSVRAGIGDLLSEIDAGDMLIMYSGGLHHIHAPGERFPRLFKKLSLTLERINIPQYKSSLAESAREPTGAVIADLEARILRHC